MSPLKWLAPMSFLTLTLLAHAAPAEAQKEPAALELEAASLASGTPSDWDRAAALFAEAAGLRSFGEAEAISDLHAASLLRYYLGGLDEALFLMAGAAEQAVASGQVLAAAQSYIDGAWIAVELRLTPAALEFAESATLLAGSPHLTESESRLILDRLGEELVPLTLSER